MMLSARLNALKRKNGTMLIINPVNKGSSSIKKWKEKCSKITVEVSLSFNLSWGEVTNKKSQNFNCYGIRSPRFYFRVRSRLAIEQEIEVKGERAENI